MHSSVLGFFGQNVGREPVGHVLEVGSLDVNGSVRPFFVGCASYIGVDLISGQGVDRVLRAEDLIQEFGLEAFDVVVSSEMLEHARAWRRCLLNMLGVLAPGGQLFLTTRSPGFPHHEYPVDCWRFTPEFMAQILHRMNLEIDVLESDPEQPGIFVKARRPQCWPWPDLEPEAAP